jgi:hypothetical protein
MSGPSREENLKIVLWSVLALAATAFVLYVVR